MHKIFVSLGLLVHVEANIRGELCSDISTYDPVIWHEGSQCCEVGVGTPSCTITTRRECITHNVTKCHTEVQEKVTMKDCPIETTMVSRTPENFTPYKHVEVPHNISHTKYKFECTNKTRLNCENVWVTNAAGEKQSIQNTCENVTWVDCAKRPYNGIFTSVKHEKIPKAPIPYETCFEMKRKSDQMCLTVKKVPVSVCKKTPRQECEDVEVKLCVPTTGPKKCLNATVPWQNRNHTEKCLKPDPNPQQEPCPCRPSVDGCISCTCESHHSNQGQCMIRDIRSCKENTRFTPDTMTVFEEDIEIELVSSDHAPETKITLTEGRKEIDECISFYLPDSPVQDEIVSHRYNADIYQCQRKEGDGEQESFSDQQCTPCSKYNAISVIGNFPINVDDNIPEEFQSSNCTGDDYSDYHLTQCYNGEETPELEYESPLEDSTFSTGRKRRKRATVSAPLRWASSTAGQSTLRSVPSTGSCPGANYCIRTRINGQRRCCALVIHGFNTVACPRRC